MGLFGIVKYDREQFDGWWLIAMQDAICFFNCVLSVSSLPTVNKDARCNSSRSLNKNIPLLSVS